jgi:hypothetical protein
MRARTRRRPEQCGLLERRDEVPHWRRIPEASRREAIRLLAEMLLRHVGEFDNDEADDE